MIIDSFLQFDPTGTSVAIAVGTQASTNVIDLHMAGIPTLVNGQGARDIGIGDDPALKLYVAVTTTFTSDGAGTLSVSLEGATDNGSGVPAAYSVWWVSPVYALATLVAGARLMDMDMPRPPDGIAIPRFLRLLYTVAGATMTAGAVTAEIVLDRQDQYYTGTINSTLSGYPAGITVSN